MSKHGISRGHVICSHIIIQYSHWHSTIVVYMHAVRLPNSSSLTVPSVNPSRSGGFHCGLCTVPKKCLRRSLASTNCLPAVGKSNPSVRSLWTLRSIMLLRRCWDIVDLRYVLMHRTAERDLSPVAMVTGIVR